MDPPQLGLLVEEIRKGIEHVPNQTVLNRIVERYSTKKEDSIRLYQFPSFLRESGCVPSYIPLKVAQS